MVTRKALETVVIISMHLSDLWLQGAQWISGRVLKSTVCTEVAFPWGGFQPVAECRRNTKAGPFPAFFVCFWKTWINTGAREATNKSLPLIKSSQVCPISSSPIFYLTCGFGYRKLVGTQKPWSWYNNIDLLADNPAFYLPSTQWFTRPFRVRSFIWALQKCSEAGGAIWC